MILSPCLSVYKSRIFLTLASVLLGALTGFSSSFSTFEDISDFSSSDSSDSSSDDADSSFCNQRWNSLNNIYNA